MARVPGFVKWVLGPLLAGVLGYTVVAPRLGGKIPLAKLGIPALGGTKTIPAPEPPAEESKPPENPGDASTAAPSPAPSVTVGVKPVAEATTEPRREREREEEPKPRRRRRRRRTRPSEAPRRERTPERTAEPAPSEPAPAAPTGPDPASTPDG